MNNHEVLLFLQTIPKGKVTTYKYLSQVFALHPRSIASILKKNTQQDIYPCYKVVMSDGKMWWYNLWISEKMKRLQNDGIELKDGKVDKKHFLE